jgi:hypothetical protein
VTRIQLCGTLSATIGGRRIEQELPGRQGRLAIHRAEAAVSLEDWTRAWAPARIALHVTRRDNVAEALRVYESLRCLLRDELGIVPAAATQELHKDLLATHKVGVS